MARVQILSGEKARHIGECLLCTKRKARPEDLLVWAWRARLLAPVQGRSCRCPPARAGGTDQHRVDRYIRGGCFFFSLSVEGNNTTCVVVAHTNCVAATLWSAPCGGSTARGKVLRPNDTQRDRARVHSWRHLPHNVKVRPNTPVGRVCSAGNMMTPLLLCIGVALRRRHGIVCPHGARRFSTSQLRLTFTSRVHCRHGRSRGAHTKI